MANETSNPSTAGSQGRKEAAPAQQGKAAPSKPDQGSAAQGSQQASGALSRRGTSLPSLFGTDFWSLSPLSLVSRMMEDIGSVFDDLDFARGGRGLARRAERQQRGMSPLEGFWSPPMEVMERDGKLIVRAELPGLSADDVHLDITDDALILEGERRQEAEEGDRKGGTYRTERIYGSFRRVLPMPPGADPESAEARFENGVLEISLKLSQERSGRRRIEIQGGKQQSGSGSVH
jgi:HSP20 family protein